MNELPFLLYSRIAGRFLCKIYYIHFLKITTPRIYNTKEVNKIDITLYGCIIIVL